MTEYLLHTYLLNALYYLLLSTLLLGNSLKNVQKYYHYLSQVPYIIHVAINFIARKITKKCAEI